MAATGTFQSDVRAAFQEAVGRLRQAGIGSPGLAAELLLMHVLGRNRAWLYAHPEERLEPRSVAHYFDLVKRRAAGEPTQYLTGRQEFWGLELEVTPDVLIPRPETEHVVEVALERLRRDTDPSGRSARHSEALRIADVGTGSGCLAIALGRELPEANVFATDISSAALEVARRNAVRHGVAARVHLVRCNLLEAFLQTDLPVTTRQPPIFHLVVSNPPYIARSEAAALPREVREHEPKAALFASDDGHALYAPLLAQAAELLLPGGSVVVELGYDSLAPVLASVESSDNWTSVSVKDDLAGIPRVLAAERSQTTSFLPL